MTGWLDDRRALIVFRKQLTEVLRQLLCQSGTRNQLHVTQLLVRGQLNAVGREPVGDQTRPDGLCGLMIGENGCEYGTHTRTS